jgi:hypothetical protein
MIAPYSPPMLDFGAKIGLQMSNYLLRAIFRAALLLALGAAMAPAEADNGTLYVAPGPTTLVSPDVVKRSQDQLAGTTRKLGDLIGSSLRSSTSHATDLAVTTKCGHYQSATITYADGTARTLNLSNAPASQKDMDQAKAAIPILRIIDVGGCDG